MACGLKLNFRLPDISPCRYRKQTIQSPRREILFFLWLPTPRFSRLLPRLKESQPLPSPRKRATESRSLSSLPRDAGRFKSDAQIDFVAGEKARRRLAVLDGRNKPKGNARGRRE